MYIYMYFWVFSSSRNEKKKSMKKKKKVQEWVGLCLTVSQYNGKLYCDTAGFGECKMVVECVTIQPLYCDRGGS